MECRLPIIRADFDTTERAGCLFRFVVRIIAIGIAGLLAFQSFEHRALIAMVTFLVLAWGLEVLLRRTFPDWVRKRDHIGEVTLRATGMDLRVSSETRSVAFPPGSLIDIDTHHVQGRARFYRDIRHNGIGTLTISKDQDPIVVKFLVRNKRDLSCLLEVLKTWYHQGYRVHETIGAPSKSVFLMKWDWSYEDLRKAKEEYGLAQLWPSIRK